MNFDEALEVIACEMVGRNYIEVERKLLEAFKRVYQIEDLHVYVLHEALHLSDEHPQKLIGHPNLKHANPNELLWRLNSFVGGQHSRAYYDGRRFESLDELRKHRLLKKLSGIQ